MRRYDWRGWLTLAWVVATGALYARMILRQRAPGLWGAIRDSLALP